MDISVRGMGVGLTHTESLLIKNLRIARETDDLEAETGDDPKKPDIGRVVESYFNLPNEYSSSIILTDSDFKLTNRTCAIAITADKSFKIFLWKRRPGTGGVAALPPAASQILGKYLCFLVTRATEKRHVVPGKPILVLDEIERLPCGKGSEGAFNCSVRSEQRTTASTGAVCTDTRNFL